MDRSAAFYEDVIGLDTLERGEGRATMGSGGRPVLELVADPDATPPGREAGLYHVALLYPSREELAHVAQRLMASRTPVQGASDHHTHEAFYLPDPDGNGLELAADRPREQWPDLQDAYDLTKGAPQPLDVADLMRLVDGQPVVARAEPGVRVGHLHLHVGDVDEGLAFYRDVIGFDEIANMGTAAFVSAGGYHHHLGFNTWRGEGVPPAGEGRLGLREWTVLLPDGRRGRRARARGGRRHRHRATARRRLHGARPLAQRAGDRARRSASPAGSSPRCLEPRSSVFWRSSVGAVGHAMFAVSFSSRLALPALARLAVAAVDLLHVLLVGRAVRLRSAGALSHLVHPP